VPSIALAALFTIPMGIGGGLAWVTGYTLLQENVGDEFRGRTFATLTTMVRLALFLSLLVFPLVSSAIPAHRLSIGFVHLLQPGTRFAMWLGCGVAALGGLIARRGMGRHHIAKARALSLIPKFARPEHGGLFVAFEGVEGSGKGTQIAKAREFVVSLGREVVVCREPGGTGFGERLRETILDPGTGKVDARAEALLFAAARAHLVTTVIGPALEEGKVVLCDRFIASSLADQGVARGLGEPDVLTLNAWATQGLFPDLVLLLHLDPEVGLARAGKDPDRIESED